MDKKKIRLHTKSNHEYWMCRNGRCPYCDNGSIPVDKNVIINMVNNGGVVVAE